jgi:hypothetical protein
VSVIITTSRRLRVCGRACAGSRLPVPAITSQRSPGAPPAARFGAVAFVLRFGSCLNCHAHFSRPGV